MGCRLLGVPGLTGPGCVLGFHQGFALADVLEGNMLDAGIGVVRHNAAEPVQRRLVILVFIVKLGNQQFIGRDISLAVLGMRPGRAPRR